MTTRDLGSILKDTAKRCLADDITGLASQAAFAFAFSLFPALLALVTTVGLLGRSPEFMRALVDFLRPLLPGETLNLLLQYLQSLSASRAGSVLSVSLVLTVWSASGVVTAYMKAVNRAYAAEREQAFVRKRLVAAAISLLAGLVAIVAFLVMVLAPVVGNLLERYFGLGDVYQALFDQLRFPFALVALAGAYAILYRLGPNVKHYWAEVVPGALLATWLWIAVTTGFSLYVERFGSYDKTYGSLGAVIVLLTWMYLTSLVVIVGAEFNAAFGAWLRARQGPPSNSRA
jgi:membrane protein